MLFFPWLQAAVYRVVQAGDLLTCKSGGAGGNDKAKIDLLREVSASVDAPFGRAKAASMLGQICRLILLTNLHTGPTMKYSLKMLKSRL